MEAGADGLLLPRLYADVTPHVGRAARLAEAKARLVFGTLHPSAS